MKTAQYLDRLLLRYSGTFDIYQPYCICKKKYPAYGYFFSHVEKYVLVREANMWSSDSFEHMLFDDPENLTVELLNEYMELIKSYMEPVLVRKEEKLPNKNHMYSYLTISVVTQKPLSKEVIKAIKKFKFEKSYMHNIRGYSQAHIAVASMDDQKVYTNWINRKSKKLYKEIFSDVEKGKPGFEEILKKQGKTPYQQVI